MHNLEQIAELKKANEHPRNGKNKQKHEKCIKNKQPHNLEKLTRTASADFCTSGGLVGFWIGWKFSELYKNNDLVSLTKKFLF